MTDSFKKQLCYAGGTLTGWLLSKLLGAKEAAPYTIMGGLAGFAIGEDLVAESHTRPPIPIAGPKARPKKRNKPAASAV